MPASRVSHASQSHLPNCLTDRLADGTSALADGAKRDRLVWPGDIAISGPTMCKSWNQRLRNIQPADDMAVVSTNSLDGIRNGIDSLFLLQQSDGRLPWAGVPFTSSGNFPFSFTYHLYTLLDLYYYFMFTGDTAYLTQYWDQYKLALDWSLGTIDGSQMANVTSSNDWLRSGMGGHNIEVGSLTSAERSRIDQD